jgi:hypothetical protein
MVASGSGTLDSDPKFQGSNPAPTKIMKIAFKLWTNIIKQDKALAKFSTLDLAVLGHAKQ